MPSSITILIILTGTLVILGLIFWPEGGGLARWKARSLTHQRRQLEDALKFLFDAGQAGQPATLGSLAQALRISAADSTRLSGQMQAQGLVKTTGEPAAALELTPEGMRWALQMVRAHRLWERYLADEARIPLEQIHTIAHRREHGMSSGQIDELDAALGHPSRDPHGDPIPDAAGQLRQHAHESGCARPLSSWAAGERAQITHLEDEPLVAYAQILAVGLYVGQVLTVLESTSEKIILTDGENEFVVAAPVAANIFLCPLEELQARPADAIPLSRLTGQMKAEIVELDERCQGFTRRRFLDLGLTPGTLIFPELENAFHEPRAYRVRGTLIALRNDQAAYIWVRPAGQNTGSAPI